MRKKPHTPKYLILFYTVTSFQVPKTSKKMSILAPNSQILYREIYNRENQHLFLNSGGNLNIVKSYGFCFVDKRRGDWKKKIKREFRIHASWADLSRPAAVEMQPIESSEQLDQILDSAKELSQPIIIDWMATWCRKCIYLKPKLEKLAAEFDTKLKFYYVDVNKVPQTLVKRGNISKMPTIQLWKDGEMKAEVIGGHKAWLVIEEVREMIKNFI